MKDRLRLRLRRGSGGRDLRGLRRLRRCRNGSVGRSRFALLRVVRRRGATADRDLTFVDHEAAHGDDVVGGYVAQEPQRQIAAALDLPDDVAQVAQLFGEQLLVFLSHAP
ncbi:hypothetical protein OKW35_001987 [Paraburkholderia sp. MM5477-R1]